MLDICGRTMHFECKFVPKTARSERVTEVEQFSRYVGLHHCVQSTLFFHFMVQMLQNQKLDKLYSFSSFPFPFFYSFLAKVVKIMYHLFTHI